MREGGLPAELEVVLLEPTCSWSWSLHWPGFCGFDSLMCNEFPLLHDDGYDDGYDDDDDYDDDRT